IRLIRRRRLVAHLLLISAHETLLAMSSRLETLDDVAVVKATAPAALWAQHHAYQTTQPPARACHDAMNAARLQKLPVQWKPLQGTSLALFFQENNPRSRRWPRNPPSIPAMKPSPARQAQARTFVRTATARASSMAPTARLAA